MTVIFYIDQKPIYLNTEASLAPALEFLRAAGEDFDTAKHELLRDMLDSDYLLLLAEGLTDQQWSEAEDAMLIALFGLKGDAVLNEYAWVIYHLEDLRADFLRFYGTDYSALDSRTFFSLAERVHAYGGVMSHRFRQEKDNQEVERIYA